MDERERQLIVAALGEPELAHQAWIQWRSGFADYRDAPHVLSWAGGYIYTNLSSAGIEEKYLRGIYRHNWLSNNYRLQQSQELLKRIIKDFSIVPLKSFGISIEDNSLGHRPVADFDFYVDVSEMKRIIRILREENYEPLMGLEEQELFDKHIGFRGSWNYMNSKVGDIDIHWRVFDHLELKENRFIVAKYSEPFTNPILGKYRQLKPEVSAVLIACHHLLDGGKFYSGVFDFSMLYNKSDPALVFEIAQLAGATEQVAKLLLDLDYALGTKHNEEWALLGQNSPTQISNLQQVGEFPRRFMPVRDRFIEHATNRHRWIYKLWLYCGMKSKWEARLLKIFGSFSRPDSYLRKPPTDITVGKEIGLGIGWHFRLPDRQFRWGDEPDTRWLATLNPEKRYHIQIDFNANAWNYKTEKELELYVAGIFLGAFSHDHYTFDFPIPEHLSGLVEFSLRLNHPQPLKPLGVNFSWERLSAPVAAIRLIERH